MEERRPSRPIYLSSFIMALGSLIYPRVLGVIA